MIIDERTYSVSPGRLAEYLEQHMKHGLPVMRRHLGEPHGYFTTETGDLNQFVHWWRYEDMADRERRRNGLYADPEWLAYRKMIGETGWVQHQHNRLLKQLLIKKA
jgi:hypothetical protein